MLECGARTFSTSPRSRAAASRSIANRAIPARSSTPPWRRCARISPPRTRRWTCGCRRPAEARMSTTSVCARSWSNLLSNASKFTPPRGRIVVVARKNPDGGATIAVADTGVGMSADQIAVAMTPFGQVQGHLSRTQEGAGLGLPIARGLARQPWRRPPRGKPARRRHDRVPDTCRRRERVDERDLLPPAAGPPTRSRNAAAFRRRPAVQIAHVVSVAGSHCHRDPGEGGAEGGRRQGPAGADRRAGEDRHASLRRHGQRIGDHCADAQFRRPGRDGPDRDQPGRRGRDRRRLEAADLQARRDADCPALAMRCCSPTATT